MNTIEPFIGAYQGTGTWHDAAGKSASYRVEQANLVTAGGFEVSFKHDFEDGTATEARFTMTWIAPGLFRVEVSGTPVGNGYVFGDYCHYHLRTGDAFVEASYRSSANDLDVFGSSSKNAEGHYIAWRETLRRTAAPIGSRASRDSKV